MFSLQFELANLFDKKAFLLTRQVEDIKTLFPIFNRFAILKYFCKKCGPFFIFVRYRKFVSRKINIAILKIVKAKSYPTRAHGLTFKVYMTDFFLFARSILSEMLIST